MENTSTPTKQVHHERLELCTNRPRYRQGRNLTAIKVYSVMDESKYLLIHRVPAIAVTAELETLCQGFGSIDYLHCVPDYPTEKFCEVYLVKFHTLQSARFAKRKMDDKSFYGGILHVCYAPELETLDETHYKLLSRAQEIGQKLIAPQNLKRKQPGIQLPVHVAEQPSSSIAMKEEISDHKLCNKSKNSISEKNDAVVAAKNSEQPNSKLPVKQIVYHKRKKAHQTSIDSN